MAPLLYTPVNGRVAALSVCGEQSTAATSASGSSNVVCARRCLFAALSTPARGRPGTLCVETLAHRAEDPHEPVKGARCGTGPNDGDNDRKT